MCMERSYVAKPRVPSQLTSFSKCLKSFKPMMRHVTTVAEVPTIQQSKWIGRWLGTCAGMCFGAVVIGKKNHLHFYSY